MQIKESEYLKTIIEELPIDDNTNILNIGSQSESYIKTQPYIRRNIVEPTKKKKAKIVNLDIFEGPGVDLVGDITDKRFAEEIKNKFNIIYSFNVLEHVTDIAKFTRALESIVPSGGYILISVPYKYPIHYDPIDNGFRPKPNELLNYFTNCEIQKSEIVQDFTYWYYLTSSPKRIITEIVRILTPFYRFNKWKKVVIPKIKWINKKFEVTCVLLKKR